MNRIQLAKDEQETSIVVDPATKKAKVYSCVPAMIKKIESLSKYPEVEVLDDNKYGITVRVPMQWIKVVKPQKRVYTEEQKEALRTHIEQARMVAQANKAKGR